LHTSDWHLGLSWAKLSESTQAEYTRARIDVVSKIAALADEAGCEFVVVSGDIFDSNQVDDKTLRRSLDAMAEFKQPLLLLPGNHDALDASSVYRRETFESNKPENVIVLETPGIHDVPGTAHVVAAAPLLTRHTADDLAATVVEGLDERGESATILVAHGVTDVLNPDRDRLDAIRVGPLETAIGAGMFKYVALGDRHGFKDSGQDTVDRIVYSGSPLISDYREVDANEVAIVTLDGDSVEVDRRVVGEWNFISHEVELNSSEDVDALEEWLLALNHKPETVVRMARSGVLSLTDFARVDKLIEDFGDRLALLEIWDRNDDLHVAPTDDDFEQLDLSGYAAEAMEDLRLSASGEGADSETARDALNLLFRLQQAAS
jgi:DNA repair exonuclease SbcCD nuclease subunit